MGIVPDVRRDGGVLDKMAELTEGAEGIGKRCFSLLRLSAGQGALVMLPCELPGPGLRPVLLPPDRCLAHKEWESRYVSRQERVVEAVDDSKNGHVFRPGSLADPLSHFAPPELLSNTAG